MDIEQLIALANFLDESGATEEADRIDALIKGAADVDVGGTGLLMPEEELKQDEELSNFESPDEYKSRVLKESPSLEQWTKSVQDDLSSYLQSPEEKSYHDLLDALTQYRVRWEAERMGKGASSNTRLAGVPDELPDDNTEQAYELYEKSRAEQDEYRAQVFRDSPPLKEWITWLRKDLTLFLKNPMGKFYDSMLNSLKEYQVRWQAERAGKSASQDVVFEKLAEISDRLDLLGARAEADMVDAFIAKHAAKKKEAPVVEAPVSKADQVLEVKPEADTEQSKRYDDKHHHSLQVREPKSQKERMDLEGYKDTHHIHTYQPVKEAMEKEAASTRYCPEHIGVSLGRVGEATYQCPLDGKTYNWEVGFTDYDGKHHAGGSVAAQTPDSSGYEIPHRIFDSRENILNRVN